MNRKLFSELLLRSLFTKQNSHITQLARRNYSVWERAAMSATRVNMFNGPNRMMMSTNNGGTNTDN